MVQWLVCVSVCSRSAIATDAEVDLRFVTYKFDKFDVSHLTSPHPTSPHLTSR